MTARGPRALHTTRRPPIYGTRDKYRRAGGGEMTRITVQDVRKLGGFRLPGEWCAYSGRFRVPEGCLEVFGLVYPRVGTPYLSYRLGPATPQALKLARRLRAAEEEAWEAD